MVTGCGYVVSFSCSPRIKLIRHIQNDIHETAKWSAPSPGGVTRLCADENDKMARDWFREQVLALGADYKVNATGTQFAKFEGEDDSIPPIAMGSHMDTVATGGKFDGPLGVSLAPTPRFHSGFD
jgi:N-carbamoyl-L-amino-acid hydrolase